jgi:flagellar hook-associated protein 1 FlgK
MSISSALANALTGLNAAGRSAAVASSNVANALTPGYARREVNLSAQSLGGTGAGVKVDSVTRSVDRTILAERRLADAELSNADVRTGFLQGIEDMIGEPGAAGSLSDRLASFESALIRSVSLPDSDARLDAVVTSAARLAGHLNTLSDAVQGARATADADIADTVAALNDKLGRIDKLNENIVEMRSAGRDATALMDQRQALIDQVSSIVPVREVARERDRVALFTTGGAILLEGEPLQVGFTSVNTVTADMTLSSGALSGLTINGIAVSPRDNGVMGGGSLGALFAVRDELAPGVQVQIDAFARDIIERFASPATDPTLAPGMSGLFTDGGAALNPADEIGLAGRIEINNLVVASAGGALWHVRAGLGAAVPGDVGDGRVLQSMADALILARPPVSGGFSGAARTSSGLAADILSRVSGTRQLSESQLSYASARQEALKTAELQDGVDTDAEMQNLLLIEQAFSANARVVQTMDELIQQLIRL